MGLSKKGYVIAGIVTIALGYFIAGTVTVARYPNYQQMLDAGLIDDGFLIGAWLGTFVFFLGPAIILLIKGLRMKSKAVAAQ